MYGNVSFLGNRFLKNISKVRFYECEKHRCGYRLHLVGHALYMVALFTHFCPDSLYKPFDGG